MRLNWIIGNGMSPTIGDVHDACHRFFNDNKILPDTLKMAHRDLTNFYKMFPQTVQTLDRNKEYGQYVCIPGGLIELLILEDCDESVATNNGDSFMVLECTKTDREFEKIVLNKDGN